jgi:hypothetical protein
MRHIQPSMAGGEFSPALRSRVDLAKYNVGLSVAKNIIIHPHGGASNRPGLEFIGEIKNSAARARIVEFEADAGDTYILEFGNSVMRIYRNGAIVIYPIGHPSVGQIVEIATPYPIADVFSFKWEQSQDVLTFTHQGYTPRDLTRFDHHDWRWTTIDFVPVAAAPTGVGAVATMAYTPPATSGAAAESHDYKIATILANGEESLPSASATCSNILGYTANYNTVTWAAVAGAERYAVYKARNGTYGLVGYTDGLFYKDVNYAANFADGPQTGRNPFNGVGNYPRVSGYFQQRRMYASTALAPVKVFGSQTGNFKNMGVSTPVKDNDALEFSLAYRKKQRILNMIALEDLILFTPTAEWKVSGNNGDILSPSSIMPKPQSFYGSADIKPIVCGEQILFVQNKGQAIRDLEYSFQANRYQGLDRTIMAQHLFRTYSDPDTGNVLWFDRTIVGWTWQQSPNSIIWIWLSDGGLISLTYMKEHEVWAWSRHEIDGFVEDGTSVSEGQEDAAYFVIRRTINGQTKRYIERLRTRQFLDIRYAFFVDCGLSYNVPLTITGIAVGASTVVTSAAHGVTVGQLVTLEQVTGCALFDETGAISRSIAGQYQAIAVTTNTITLGDPVDGTAVDTSALPAYVSGGILRKCVSTLSGLSHLAGRTVVGLADGNVIGDAGELVVALDGTLALPNPAGLVHIGLPYTSDLQTLDLEPGQETAQGVLKSVAKCVLRVERSRGLLAGASFDKLNLNVDRDVEAFREPIVAATGDVEVTFEPGWDKHGRVCVRQSFPLPMTILSIVPDFSVGG